MVTLAGIPGNARSMLNVFEAVTLTRIRIVPPQAPIGEQAITVVEPPDSHSQPRLADAVIVPMSATAEAEAALVIAVKLLLFDTLSEPTMAPLRAAFVSAIAV